MFWTFRFFFVVAGFVMDRVSAGEQCREERSINGMALQGFMSKKFFVRALHECDISCESEITCQSYNYVLGEKSCELNNRTKEARPEHFRSDPARFYKRRLSNRGTSEKTRELKHRRFWATDINRKFMFFSALSTFSCPTTELQSSHFSIYNLTQKESNTRRRGEIAKLFNFVVF